MNIKLKKKMWKKIEKKYGKIIFKKNFLFKEKNPKIILNVAIIYLIFYKISSLSSHEEKLIIIKINQKKNKSIICSKVSVCCFSFWSILWNLKFWGTFSQHPPRTFYNSRNIQSTTWKSFFLSFPNRSKCSHCFSSIFP